MERYGKLTAGELSPSWAPAVGNSKVAAPVMQKLMPVHNSADAHSVQCLLVEFATIVDLYCALLLKISRTQLGSVYSLTPLGAILAASQGQSMNALNQ